MQGVQGILKSGRTRLASYENYALDRCPECRAHLVRTNEEDGGERACSRCGIVTGRANSAHRDGSSTPSVSKDEPLGSYIIANSSGSGPSPNGPAFGWTRLIPYIVDRPTPLLKCSRLTGRIAEKLALPRSIVQSAEIKAKRLLVQRESCEATIPSISAYSLLYACRAAGIVHVSHREVLKAYTDAGYRFGKSDPLKIGLESGMQLSHLSKEDLVRAAMVRLQSSGRIAEWLRKANVDSKEYFPTLFEHAKELVASVAEPNGFNPGTIAAGSVYLASLAMRPRTFTQRDTFFHELGHTLHRSFEPKSGHGQEPEAGTIAQLVAATLARLCGRPADSFSWSYISSYANSNNPQQVGRMCMRVLDRTKKVLDLIYPGPSADKQAHSSNPYLNENRSGDQRHGT